MPKPSYLQTIARRATRELPVLLPPRSGLPARRESPLSQGDGPLLPDPADELVPARPPSPANETALPSQQPLPVAPLREAALPPRSPTNSSPVSAPSRVELPDEIKATPALSDRSPVNPVVQLPSPSNRDPHPTTSVPQFLQSSDPVVSLPERLAPIPALAPEISVPQARSYLQTAARMPTLESNSPLPSVSSTEASTTETAAPKVSEFVLLQPPRNHSVAPSTRPNHQNTDLPTPLDQRPLRSLTPPGNSVHIGTIDIHITPPPTPALQPVATAPKTAAPNPLSRGVTSSFGLRQG